MDIPKLPPTQCKTKIVCTLGPASASREVLVKLIEAGMDIVRLNFSHGTHEEAGKTFKLIRSLSAEYAEQISIICDIQGPKIRTGKMVAPFDVHAGDTIKVVPTELVGNKEMIQIMYEKILEHLEVKDQIFINDGIIKLVVFEKTKDYLNCNVLAGGTISDHKGCNIPSGKISMDVITPKDLKDLKFIASLNPEYIAASFIGTGEDLRTIKSTLAELGNPSIKIISKIERPIAIENIDEIIAESDAIMVARGDLGVEIPTHEVPGAQKLIVKKCNRQGKPVIVATQMLESMTFNPRPTRAEANDVYNAVLDGADAVMLSGETSIGKYPVETVRVMDDIVGTAEKYMPLRNPNDYDSLNVKQVEALAHAAFELSKESAGIGYTGKILILAETGLSTYMIAKYRPSYQVVAISSDIRTARELNLVHGVQSMFWEGLNASDGIETRVAQGIKRCVATNYITDHDHVVVVAKTSLSKNGYFMGLFNVASILGRRTTSVAKKVEYLEDEQLLQQVVHTAKQ